MKTAIAKIQAAALNLGRQKLRARAPGRGNASCQLESAGWYKHARRSLENILVRGAGRGLPVVFDFDNTILRGDIGEAVLALLSVSGRLVPNGLCETLSPVLPAQGGRRLKPSQFKNIMELYEALLAPTVHGKADPSPLANGYVWAAQVLEHLKLTEVLEATRQAFGLGSGDADGTAAIRVGTLTYPAPCFREEMVELIAQLLRLQYQPWIVSASNVWSVRWMVIHGLNPMLRQLGATEGLPPERVIGLATLLSDAAGRMYKDAVLVRENADYARLRPGLIDSLKVTRHVQFPAPVYSGKVACIFDAIGCNPYLSAGDSPSDHPMLALSKHRLWIARPDKPDAQHATNTLMKRTGKRGWIVQPVPSNTPI